METFITIENLAEEDITKSLESLATNINSDINLEIAFLLHFWALYFLGHTNLKLTSLIKTMDIERDKALDVLISLQVKGIKIGLKTIKI